MRKMIEFVACLPIYFYRFVIRPLLPKSCAFTPTCSEYALIAIRRHGPFVGWWMTTRRILRCRPFGRNNRGFDPVPWKLRGGSKWVV
ncbi:MAG: membrane protein insertion efficiency factor YidD [Firmicutes bacterium]|nr:membrane protein insertion efficiency factor YidD [Bacillota bacterium]